jgi:uncharacterized protein
MTDSLRDQLLKLGFKKPEPPARPAVPARTGQRPPPGKPAAAAGQPQRPGGNPQNRNPQRPQDRPQRPGQGKPAQQAKSAVPRSQEEIDLARAYALRDRQEREEKEAARREAELKARERRERRLRLQALVAGKTVNDPAAELLRHFPHRDKIKRVHVNESQLAALNAGALGVVQIEGRYLLVDRETALAVQLVFADALVLLPEPGSQDEDEIAAVEPAAIAAG